MFVDECTGAYRGHKRSSDPPEQKFTGDWELPDVGAGS